MTNAEDKAVLLAHGVDELLRSETLVVGGGEVTGSTVKRATETVTNGQETSNKRGDKVLPGTS